ncbi:MAG: hypothetical protein PF518_02905 [Spirochaetaceae bacterium]|jgi:autonomous glycyl radical cofactor GrcA|nr:hypothetical protein [Spirochaetaceae bacterium]
MSNIQIIKASEKHVDSFAKALDEVAREKKYLAAIKGFPFDEILSFVKNIEKTIFLSFMP